MITRNIKEIIDGDTFDVDSPVEYKGDEFTRIRIADYDAPEKGQPGHGAATRDFIAVFSDHESPREVQLDPKAVDQYQRLICDIFVQGKDIKDYLSK